MAPPYQLISIKAIWRDPPGQNFRLVQTLQLFIYLRNFSKLNSYIYKKLIKFCIYAV